MANSATIETGHRDGSVRGAVTQKPKRFWLLALGVFAIGSSVVGGAKMADHVIAGRSGATGGWHGKIAKVVRGGGASEGGVTVDGVAAGAGAAVSGGARIVTDGRTEARIELDDGSTLLVDRASDLALSASGRGLNVTAGALVVDVAAAANGAPCSIKTASVTASAAVARVALTALADRTSLEVLRGDVEVGDGARATVHVSAGEEAVAATGARIEVTAVDDLGDRVAFGERLGKDHDEDAEASVSGLGELRARRPGSTTEKDHALRLARHDVRVRIVGSVARTEIDETFANDTDNELEGLYRFPLPPGALIEKLSLDVDGKLVDGSFVDKAKAAAIWRGVIQHAAPSAPKPIDQVIWVPGPWRDPALLEWQTGGRTELKIFPIPKRGSRRVVIAYTQTIAPVAGVRRYDYPLPQATASDIRIDNASFDVQVLGADPSVPLRARGYELEPSGATKLGATMSAFAPSGDLVVEYALADRSADATAWAFAEGPEDGSRPANPSDAHVVFALRPKLPRMVSARPRDQVLVIDGGRSMFGERFRRASRLAVEMVAQMDRRDRVSVLVCDLACRTLPAGFEMPGAAAAHDVDAFLASASPDGASDWVGAVRAAVAAPGRDGARDLRVTLLSGGAPNAGYRSSDRLAKEIAAALPDARAEIVTVPIGGDADVGALADVARGGGGVLVPYEPGEKLETAALDVLGATYGVTLRDVELTLPDGLVDAAPSRLSAIRAGGEALVAARLTGDRAHGDVVLRGNVGGDPFEARYPVDLVASRDAGNAFVPRLFAALRIADREREGGDAARAELVRLSQRYSVPSKFTSLLVLESEAMFHAFGIDRSARGAAWTGEQASTATLVTGVGGDEEDEKSADLSRDSDALELGALGKGGGGGAMRASPAPSKKAAPGPDDARSAADAPATHATFAPPPPPAVAKPLAAGPSPQGAPLATNGFEPRESWAPRRRPGRWMKRVFFRTAAVSASDSPVVAADKVASARASLEASPDERAKALALVRLLTRDGSTDLLADVLGRWTARDPMDADAIASRADLLERAGDRAGALRVLGGVAATASGADAGKVLGALALAEERAGDDARACALRIGAAEVTPSDVAAVASAVACERAGGHVASADRFLDDAKTPSARDAIVAAADKIASLGRSPQRVFGDVVVDASWDGGVDLDVAVVDPSGVRLGWASRARNVRASDCTSLSHEALGVSSSATGAFVVEIVRAGASIGAPIHGKLRVTSLGQTRVVPFVLSSSRAQVARIDVAMSSELVAASPNDIQAHMMSQ